MLSHLNNRRQKSKGSKQRRRTKSRLSAIQPLESRLLLTVELLSVADDNSLMDLVDVSRIDVSDDGRYVGFISKASNLVPGQVDRNFRDDLFRLDRQTGEISLLTHIGDGKTTSTEEIFGFEMSGDGSTFVFQSMATDLVPNYVRNLGEYGFETYVYKNGEISLLYGSLGSSTVGANQTHGNNDRLVINHTGDVIAFEAVATDIVPGFVDNNPSSVQDVYLWENGAIRLVSGSLGSATEGSSGESSVEAISADGSTLVFRSNSSDLISDFERGHEHVAPENTYRYQDGEITLLSGTGGSSTIGANASSFGADVNHDGSVIVFNSDATGLVPGTSDNNGRTDVFRYANGQLELVSTAHDRPSQTANDDTTGILSDDGSTIIFNSRSTNLVPNYSTEQQSGADVYRWRDGAVELLSGVNGSSTNGAGFFFTTLNVSDDGNRVSFGTRSDKIMPGTNDEGHSQFYLYDTDELILVTQAAGSSQAGNDDSGFGWISGDGSTIVVEASATDLVDNINNPHQNDRDAGYLFDIDSRSIEPFTVPYENPSASSDHRSELDEEFQSISDDGRYVVFFSEATNLVPGQIDDGDTRDIFLRDRHTNTTHLISHTGDGVTAANEDSDTPMISGDGSTVIFTSRATNIVSGSFGEEPGDNLYRWHAGQVTLVNVAVGTTDTAADMDIDDAAVNYDGSVIAFTSSASNLVSGFVDGNGMYDGDMYRYENGTISLVSRSLESPLHGADAEVDAPDEGLQQWITDDGSKIVFLSEATNLVANFTDNSDGDDNAYLVDNGNISLVNHLASAPAATSNSGVDDVRISNDGATIAFLSVASDLIENFVDRSGGDANVFRYDSNGISLVSAQHGTTNEGADDEIEEIAISGDGSTIAFSTDAANLVDGFVDNNNSSNDIFRANENGVQLASGESATAGANGGIREFQISNDGAKIVFDSYATNLLQDSVGDTDHRKIFVDNNGRKTLISRLQGTTNGVPTGSSDLPAISGDGTTVAFVSEAIGLEPFDLDIFEDVFAFSFAERGETTQVTLEEGTLRIEDVDGGDTDDNLTLTSTDSEFIITDPDHAIGTQIAGATGNGTNEIRVPRSGINEIVFDSLGGSDTLRIDNPDGSITQTITVNGGSPSEHPADELYLNVPFTTPLVTELGRDGSFTPTQGGVIHWTDVEKIHLNDVPLAMNGITVFGTDGADRILVSGQGDQYRVQLNRVNLGPFEGERLRVLAGLGNDQIRGGGASPNHVFELFGGEGRDFIITNTGYNIVVGGPGDDYISYANGQAFGDGPADASSPEALFDESGLLIESATDGRDRINVLSGNTVNYGGGQRDYIFSQRGNNYIHGGSGNDVIGGGTGDDVLMGGPGDDLLTDRGGNNLLVGGSGNDRLLGSRGLDVLIGGSGRDMLLGNTGVDLLIDGTASGVDAALSDEAEDFNDDEVSAALLEILADWNANQNVAPQGLGNLAHDGEADFLQGGTHNDLFFFDDADRDRTDMRSGDRRFEAEQAS